MPTPTQLRMTKIVNDLIALSQSSTQDAHSFANALDEMLNEIAAQDGFGTEVQSDPRGDGRVGAWSMTYVEGLDDVHASDDDSRVQQRVVLVLERMLNAARSGINEAEMFFDGLDFMLYVLRDNDVFGSEGENDPRGDAREGEWSMSRVQGAPKAEANDDEDDEDDEDDDSLSYAQVQANVVHVLSNMIALANSSVNDALAFVDDLDEMLDEIRDNDGFGSEAQGDPRGDGRDGSWSMSCVEGLDNRDDDQDSPVELVQTRVRLVLERILSMVKASADNADMFSAEFDIMLDYLHNEDVFGDQGENDPRGNMTQGKWSMAHVQGVDA